MNSFYTTLLTATVFMAVAVSAFASLDDLLSYKPKGTQQSKPVSDAVVVAGVSEGYLLEQAELLAVLEERLIEEYKPEGRLVIRFLQEWGGLKLSSSAWDIELIKMQNGVLLPQFALKFKITAHGEIIGRWEILTACEVWRNGLITNKQINAGQTPTMADFAVQEIDILRENKGVVASSTDIAKYVAKQTIPANRPLYWKDLTPRAMVGKGEMVNVIAVQGKLVINMHALALEDGAYGDVITLRNKDSNKRIQAEVIDEKKVKVYL